MITELSLYDRDEGLFKQILNLSTVIGGRYFVLSEAIDINSSNFRQYISDQLTGISPVTQKYPVALVLPPRSQHDEGDVFFFTMFFLTRAGVTGQNKLKEIDTNTQTSTHHAWYDWKDMAECARNFLSALNKTIRIKYVDSVKIGTMLHLLPEGRDLIRISNIGNDNVSGVRLTFRMQMNADCELQDYDQTQLSNLTISSLNIHPLHKH